MAEIKTAQYKYAAIPPPNNSTQPDKWIVEIVDGNFKGVIFRYTEWEIIHEKDIAGNENFKLSFDFMSPDPRASRENTEFLSLIGNILLDILTETAKLDVSKNQESNQNMDSQ